MGRRAVAPLDKRKNLILFLGDWERLEDLLRPMGVPTGVFLRQLIRKKIDQLETAANDAAGPATQIDADELIQSLESGGS